MNTTQALNKRTTRQQGRTTLGFTGRVRAFWRDQQEAQELLIEKQTPWLNRH
ncbi:MAG TPA: hypothetical protein VG502_18795 [Flexivirga sp.]|uniref:hypothetical protein n=1 Tax=Flexivirga sp. TaxID=1962927 RepID=UPI002CC98AFC|nr:hypothetical protein [Flexivirga sp.]HWC24348.1 hypothetical protein [Flexivirga sp.]